MGDALRRWPRVGRAFLQRRATLALSGLFTFTFVLAGAAMAVYLAAVPELAAISPFAQQFADNNPVYYNPFGPLANTSTSAVGSAAAESDGSASLTDGSGDGAEGAFGQEVAGGTEVPSGSVMPSALSPLGFIAPSATNSVLNAPNTSPSQDAGANTDSVGGEAVSTYNTPQELPFVPDIGSNSTNEGNGSAPSAANNNGSAPSSQKPAPSNPAGNGDMSNGSSGSGDSSSSGASNVPSSPSGASDSSPSSGASDSPSSSSGASNVTESSTQGGSAAEMIGLDDAMEERLRVILVESYNEMLGYADRVFQAYNTFNALTLNASRDECLQAASTINSLLYETQVAGAAVSTRCEEVLGVPGWVSGSRYDANYGNMMKAYSALGTSLYQLSDAWSGYLWCEDPVADVEMWRSRIPLNASGQVAALADYEHYRAGSCP